MERNFITHPIPPFYDGQSKVLVLGSFPSVKSREQGFFYGNSKNRFWLVLAKIYGENEAKTVEDKKAFLKKHAIALYDVILSCEISGSSDSSIKNVVPSDISKILRESSVEKIFLNGKTAKKLYDKYIFESTGLVGEVLPSTSPANASADIKTLIEAWEKITDR